ncbi:MAG TPA: SlyX family protein [Parvibaculum sp.]
MPKEKSLTDRIDELEIHLAHQDEMLEDLHQAVAAQQAEIAELTRRLGALGSRLQTIEENADAPPPVEPPPPHY